MKRKVIIFIDTAILGGPGKGILQLLRNETSQKYSYMLCGFQYRPPRSTQFIEAARAAGCDLRLLPQRFRFDPTAITAALTIARSEGVALIQSHGYKSHVVAQVVARRLGKPWLAMTHGWTSEDWKVRIYNHLERWLLQQANIAAVVSAPLLQEIGAIRGPGRPTRLIPNAVDAEEIVGNQGGAFVRDKYRIPPSSILIGVFGRLSPEKGVLNGLEAFHRLVRRNEGARLLYVGDGPLRAAIEERVTELGLGQYVTLAGYQSEMRDFYDAINLLMIPSLSEGLPNVLLEAMALGIPSVSTRVGAIPEVVRHCETGWLVPPGDVEALARQLQDAIATPSQLREIGTAAQDSLYPRFSPAARAEKFVAIYDELIGVNGTT